MEFIRVPSRPDNVSTTSTSKNKVTKTPFYFFMMSKKSEWEAVGQWSANRPMTDLVNKTYPIWKQKQDEDPEFMAPYIEMHRRWKYGGIRSKFDALGRPLIDIARESARLKKKAFDMEKEIVQTVESRKQNGSLISSLFYVGYFNYLVMTDEGFYVPCEGAVVEFSLEKGITRCWQEFLSPLDSMPEGYLYRCIKFSRVSHYLCPKFENYVTDYTKVLASLQEFLCEGKPDHQAALPPIYVMPDHVDAAECITKFIMEKAEYDGKTQQLRVFTLPKLVYNLYNASSEVPWPVECIAEYTMDIDPYSHYLHLGCDFHEVMENPVHCALSISKRLVFSLSEACCAAHKLPLKKGRHLPPEQDSSSSLSLEERKNLTRLSHVREEGGRINRFVPAVCGVTSIPDELDINDIIHGERGGYYPGLHPELRSTYQTVLQADREGTPTTYTGNTFYILDTASDVGVKMGSSSIVTSDI